MRKRTSLLYMRNGKRVTVGDVLFLKWENGKTEKCKVAEFSDVSNEPIGENGRHIFLDYVVWEKSSLKGPKVKDTRIFKIRREDGLFATRNHGYGGVHWGETGTMWRGAGPLKMAFNSSLKGIDWHVCEIVVYELKETSILDRKDFK